MQLPHSKFILPPVVLLFLFLLSSATRTATELMSTHDSTTVQSPPVLSLLSYNLYFMSKYIMPFWGQILRADRMLQSDIFTGHDVIVLQEAWDFTARTRLLKGLYDKGYIYQTQVVARKKSDWSFTGGKYCPLCPYNGGVVIVSRWEIEEKSQWVYSQGCGMDYFANKGFAYVKIKVRGYPLHIVGTHLQADDGGCKRTTPRSVRETQLEELAGFIRDKNIDNELVLIAGDFNINRSTEKGSQGNEAEYDQMLRLLDADPAMRLEGPLSTFDPATNGIAGYNFPDGEAEYLDHVVMRKGGMKAAERFFNTEGKKWMELETVQTVMEVHTKPYKLGLPYTTYKEFSDHYPITYTIQRK